MGRKKAAVVAVEGPVEARERLVAELRLFNHREAADLLEADGWVRKGLGILADFADNKEEG